MNAEPAKLVLVMMKTDFLVPFMLTFHQKQQYLLAQMQCMGDNMTLP